MPPARPDLVAPVAPPAPPAVTRRLAAAAAVALWLALGLVAGTQEHLLGPGTGAAALARSVARQTLAAVPWLVVGTGVATLAARVPIAGPTWRTRLALHAAASVAAGVAVNVLFALLRLAVGVDAGDAWRLAAVDVVRWLHVNALVYWAIVGAVHAVRAAAHHAAHRAAAHGGAARETATPAAPEPGTAYVDRLPVRTGGRIVPVPVADVDWIEGADDYARLHVGARRHLASERLAALEARLDPRRFVRVHRSTIVNVDRVRSVAHVGHGDYEAVLADGTRLRVSRTRRAALLERLGG